MGLIPFPVKSPYIIRHREHLHRVAISCSVAIPLGIAAREALLHDEAVEDRLDRGLVLLRQPINQLHLAHEVAVATTNCDVRFLVHQQQCGMNLPILQVEVVHTGERVSYLSRQKS